jgi:TRAP-type mannitol/chloroaromatic compound transport system substrate-binding protein
MKLYRLLSLAIATLFVSATLFSSESQAQTKLRIQSGFPPSSLIYLNSVYWAKQVNAMAGGRLVVEILPPGAVVPPFEILDAVSRKVVDGGHTAAAYWVGKNRAATLFGPAPGGPFGMDMMDYLGWIYDADGLALYTDFYQKDLKANVVPIPLTSVAQQALGWFKTPINSWADLKGKKCRQTGITAEVYGRAGVAAVNLPGGEIIPALERGVIECAEWTGPAGDISIGFQTVLKNFYAQSTHEPATVLEILINADVWKGLPADIKAIIYSASIEATIKSEMERNRLNASAMKEMRDKHGVTIHTTPPDILLKTLQTWDEIAKEEVAKSATFKKVYDSLYKYASEVVPSRVINSPSYEFTANYYFPPKK